MNKKLLSLLLSFLILGFMSSFAQQDEDVEEQSYRNPFFTQGAPQSIFEDGQPIQNSGWEWLHQTPQGNTMRIVKRWDANTWYAGGYGGTVMRTFDAGTTWHVNKWVNGGGSTNSNYPLYDGHAFDQNTIVAVGGNGKIVRTTDGGVNWTIIDPAGLTSSFYDVFFLNATVGYAGGTTTMDIWKTTDAGITWTGPIIIPGTANRVYAVDEDTLYFCSTSGNFRRSTDGGATWATINVGFTSALYAMEFKDPMNGWVAGASANVAYTTDGGLTWTSVGGTNIPVTSTMRDVDILPTMSQKLNEGFEDVTFPPTGWHAKNLLGTNEWSRSTTYANSGVASARISYQSTGGEDWLVTPQVNVVTGDSLVFWWRNAFSSAYPPDSLIIRISTTDTAVASFTNVLVAIDAANTPNVFTRHAYSLDSYTGNVYIAFQHKNTDGNGGYLDDVSIGEPMSVDQVFVTGDPFNIYTTTDMGATWSPISFLGSPQPWTSTYYSSDFAAANDFVTVGAFGLINEVTPADGATVHTIFLRSGSLYTIWAENNTGRVITGGAATSTTTFNQGMYSTDGGETWALSTVTDSVDRDFNQISMVSPLIGYVGREDHYVSKTTDGGATWFPVTRPAVSTSDFETCFFLNENNGYVFGAGGSGFKTTDGGTSWSTLTTGVTSILRGSYFFDVNTGYVVGSSGVVLYTTDGGTTFTPQDPNNTSTLYSIYMVNSNVGYISGSSGRVRKTTDAGVTWDTVDVGNTSPTLYTIDFRDEINGITAGSSGRSFSTTDGGETWVFENTSMSTMWGLYVEKTSPDTSTVFACGTNSYIMKNSDLVVPVELASFTASVSGNNVTLSWMTATELNNLGFQVERRAEEQSWGKVGFVDGYGTTTEPQIYTFTDAGLASGIYNYRIKQMDFDGSYKYYQLKQEVEIGTPVSYDLSQNYPNPFNPTTKINYSVPADGFVNISVYNVLGEKVTNIVNSLQKAGSYEVTFDATNFASGMYLYRMESGDFVSVKKMMILK